MKAIVNGEQITLGTCYYPEHWKEELWREDLERMLVAGIKVVRIAEFAWSILERTEGNFDFSFFDKFLDLAEEVGMQVIMGTPTATPPAWLTEKYPDALNATKDGLLICHGGRRHYNYNSKNYQRLSANIVEKMAEHYAKRSCVIGWQIDNELNCETDEFYSESDTLAFREYLQETYGNLDELNDAWGTTFWNQTYTDWTEVFVPRRNINKSTNPHQLLDYARFVSFSARRFAKMQSDILRKYIKPDDFITTNGLFGNLDNHAMTRESLDFMTYDSYPNFAYCLDDYSNKEGNLKDRKWSRNLTETRSISPIFGIMEQQSGANGWHSRMEAPTPRPGQLTLWTMQSIAHGADFISYFRWRTCTIGTEIYWHGILDYSGRENRRLREVQQVYARLQNMQEIAGAKYEAKVGVIKDYDNIWDSELDNWHRRVEEQSQKALFNAAQLTHTPMDFVYLTDAMSVEELMQYKVLFYPHATIINKARTALLQAYVAKGGILIIGCRSGYKNMYGHCVMDKLPGLFTEVTGADVPEYSFIAPDAGRVTIDWNGRELEASVFADLLEAVGENAKVEGIYTADYYAGSGALVSNSYGNGKAYYYGTAFTTEAAKVFLDNLNVIEPYGDIVTLPECCELAVRIKGDKRYLFILNYDKKEVEIQFHKPVLHIETKAEMSGKCVLKPYEALVVRDSNIHLDN